MKLAPTLQRSVGLGLAAAAIGWFAVPAPSAPPPVVRPLRDEWSLPELPRRPALAATVVQVQSADYWGKAESQAGAEPVENPRWRIAGVFGRGAGRGLLVQFAAAGKPDQRLHVGDALPSGHKICGIEASDVCVLIGGRKYRLAIERRDD